MPVFFKVLCIKKAADRVPIPAVFEAHLLFYGNRLTLMFFVNVGNVQKIAQLSLYLSPNDLVILTDTFQYADDHIHRRL